MIIFEILIIQLRICFLKFDYCSTACATCARLIGSVHIPITSEKFLGGLVSSHKDVSVVLKRKLTNGSCLVLEKSSRQGKVSRLWFAFASCNLFFHQFSPHLPVESVSVFLSPLVLSLTCLVSVFSIFRPGIFSCAQIIVMKTSSDFSRQFVVIWTPKFIHWFVVVYYRRDVQSFFVFAAGQWKCDRLWVLLPSVVGA